jgi:hypothetical protein
LYRRRADAWTKAEEAPIRKVVIVRLPTTDSRALTGATTLKALDRALVSRPETSLPDALFEKLNRSLSIDLIRTNCRPSNSLPLRLP